MKQKILAAAIASTLAVPFAAQADNTWYGRINTALKITDTDGASTNADVTGVSSRFGVKGSSDLGNGLSLGYKYEFAVDSDKANIANNNRISELALSGAFGTFKIGKFWGAAFTSTGSIMNPNNATGGQAYDSIIGGYRVGDSIAYSGGGGNLSFMVDAQIDGANAASTGVDSWNLGAVYNAGSLVIAASHSDDKGTDSDAQAIAAAWSMESMRVSGGYASNDDASGVMLRLDGKAGEGNVSWGVQFNDLEDDVNGDSDAITLNVHNEMGKGTNIWAELDLASSDSGADTNTLYLGIRKNF